VGGLGHALRQPLIVSFIGVGILVGPAGLALVTRHEQIELLASIGIAMLLFVVGLKLDVHLIRTVGPVALATGLGQVVFTSLIGFGLIRALGYPPLPAGYIAVALTFSSTIIIVKLLSDKRELDALHGRIAVGFLIVQDIAVILVMIALTGVGAGLAAGPDLSVAVQVMKVVARGLVFLGVVVALSRWVLPPLVGRLARATELLVLFAIAWAVALAAAGHQLGLSKEVGAFLAGVALASTPYREAITGRLLTVRDFLLLFFFIDLGARLDLSLLGAAAGAAIVLSAFVLLGNPLIVMAIMGVMGYRKRTGFLAGLTVAQISEFSLILGALGEGLGHIDRGAMGLITVVGLVTIGLSTYLILYSGPIYERLAPLLGLFERRTPHRETAGDTPRTPVEADIIVFGLGRYGGGIARHLRLRDRRVVGVDFDPEALARWREAGLPVVYGDAADPELFEHLPLGSARWIVSTVPDAETNRVLLRHLRQLGYAGKVAVACRTPEQEETLRVEGASAVLRPFAAAAEQAADALTSAMDRVERVAAHAPGLREARVSPGSSWAGRTIREARLPEQLGVTVLAVSRAGRSFLNPDPEFQLFPGDRLILSGEPDVLEQAIDELSRFDPGDAADEAHAFGVVELPLDHATAWHGRTLAELELRNRFGVTVVSIRRPSGQVLVPTAGHVLAHDDRLLVAGAAPDLERLKTVVAGGARGG
jgi:Kef-type K+ transport system membrane component KefB/Trk K+ transport system NAD-binding subunit